MDTAPISIDELTEQLIASFRNGEQPSVGEYCQRYPEHAEQLQKLAPTILMLENTKSAYDPKLVSDASEITELGAYDIFGLIGRGGTGVVYEAEHRTLHRRVALKVLSEPYASSADHCQRFHREVKIAAQLHHSHIVPVFEVGEELGLQYFTMKLIDGMTVQQIIRSGRNFFTSQQHDSTQVHPPFPIGDWSAIASLGSSVAKAIHFANTQGVLHRDIKPSNLILDVNRKIWITDFGLATLKGDEDVITRPGFVVGTPRYMAPEQFNGITSEKSEVFALGVTLYELLTLKPCFPENDRRQTEHLANLCQVNPCVPRELGRIIAKATDLNLHQRYANAQEFAFDLDRFVESESKLQLPITGVSKTGKTMLRFSAGISVALALYAFGRFSVSSSNDKTIQKPPVQTQQLASDENSDTKPFDIDLRRVSINDPALGLRIVEVPVSASTDDAEEYENGIVDLTSTDLELTWDEIDQIVGMRFVAMDIPRSAKIKRAYIQFTCDESNGAESNLEIFGEATDHADSFDSAKNNLTSRPKTSAVINWSPKSWTYEHVGHAEPEQRTPDLQPIVQEIVTRDGWRSGNAITILIKGTGGRCAESYDGSPKKSPLLRVEYEASTASP